MGNSLANDVRSLYGRTFETLRAIIEAFPEDKWLVPHGDDYYIPSRIAYHLVSFADGFVAGGMAKDPDFRSKAPFGNWFDGTAATLPGKAALLGYFDAVLERANAELAPLDDDGLMAALPPEMARMGSTRGATHIYAMRELSAHIGELNKMLVENGLDDIWK